MCETTPYREIKIRDLLVTLGAEHHRWTPDAATESCAARLSEPLQERILVRIEALRRSSQASLERMLGGAVAAG